MLRKFEFWSHTQTKKRDFYWKHTKQPRFCLLRTIFPDKLHVTTCPLYGTKDCCDKGGNITLRCINASPYPQVQRTQEK